MKAAALDQFLRYGAVGIFSNAVGYLLYLALAAAGLEVKIAMTLVYAIGVVQTFFFNKRWSFRHQGTHGPAFARYMGVYAFGYVLNLSILWLAVDCLRLPHQWVQATAVVAIAIALFLLQRHWVFAT